MSLIKRDPSPAQSRASRANSACSTGPRTARGTAVSTRNLPKPRGYSEVDAARLRALGESPKEFKRRHAALEHAMEPRDSWEAAWVHDIAGLRWRLERLQRAETAITTLQRRRCDYQRRRATLPAAGSVSIDLRRQVGAVGFMGLPDSAMKFQRVIEYLGFFRNLVGMEMLDHDSEPCLKVLYGSALGLEGSLMKTRVEALVRKYANRQPDAAERDQQSLLADLEKLIEKYRQMEGLYLEHQRADQVQDDAELLPPAEQFNQMMRCEMHLEELIERRREPVLRLPDSLPEPAAAPSTDADAEEPGA